MRRASVVLTVALLITSGIAGWSQAMTPYTSAELDELLGPIALYPDPLLAQVLPAATYPDQLEAAYESQGALSAIDNQPWDVSVKAVAHYPDVLTMMASSPDWTTAVGQAYVNQPEDVMRSIQRLRGKAKLLGYLSSNSQQTVTTTNGYISVVPAQAQYIYVPTYNPGVVYVQRRPSYGPSIFAFGAGLFIGAWLNNAIDWHHHRVYHHGWRGGGWVGRSRSHVRFNDRTYVNPAWTNRSVTVNRDIRSRDITNYRREIRRNPDRYAPPGLIVPVRPGEPTNRPGRRPGVPTTRPGRPDVPTTRPGGITPRPETPVTPGMPITRPGVPGTGPGVGPGAPGTRPGMPTTRPGRRGERTTRPGAVMPRPATPAERGVSPTRPSKRPNVVTPRPGRPTTSGPPAVRSTPRPSEGVSRPTPSTRQAAPRTRAKPKAGKETKPKGEGK